MNPGVGYKSLIWLGRKLIFEGRIKVKQYKDQVEVEKKHSRKIKFSDYGKREI